MSEKVSRPSDEYTETARALVEGAEINPNPIAAEGDAGDQHQPDDEVETRAAAAGGSVFPALRPLSFAELPDVLGLDGDDHIALCHNPVGGSFQARVTLCSNANAAMRAVPERSCVWFTPNPTWLNTTEPGFLRRIAVCSDLMHTGWIVRNDLFQIFSSARAPPVPDRTGRQRRTRRPVFAEVVAE